jgi:hypothetical protein
MLREKDGGRLMGDENSVLVEVMLELEVVWVMGLYLFMALLLLCRARVRL